VLVLVLVLVPVSVSISSILAVASAMLAQELIVSAPAVVVVVVVLAVTTATTAVSPSLMVRKLCDSLIDGYRERTRARVTDTRVTVLIEVTDKVVLELVFYQHIPVLMMKKTRIGVCIACILRVCRYLRRRLSNQGPSRDLNSNNNSFDDAFNSADILDQSDSNLFATASALNSSYFTAHLKPNVGKNDNRGSFATHARYASPGPGAKATSFSPKAVKSPMTAKTSSHDKVSLSSFANVKATVKSPLAQRNVGNNVLSSHDETDFDFSLDEPSTPTAKLGLPITSNRMDSRVQQKPVHTSLSSQPIHEANDPDNWDFNLSL
jgi:hypothetical protein